MTEGDRQRIGGVFLGALFQPQQVFDQLRHLHFFGAAAPHHACLTWRAEYSNTGTPLCTTAVSAAPRAWPSLRAESGLRAMNTFSMLVSIEPIKSGMMAACGPHMVNSLSSISVPIGIHIGTASNVGCSSGDSLVFLVDITIGFWRFLGGPDMTAPLCHELAVARERLLDLAQGLRVREA